MENKELVAATLAAAIYAKFANNSTHDFERNKSLGSRPVYDYEAEFAYTIYDKVLDFINRK